MTVINETLTHGHMENDAENTTHTYIILLFLFRVFFSCHYLHLLRT